MELNYSKPRAWVVSTPPNSCTIYPCIHTCHKSLSAGTNPSDCRHKFLLDKESHSSASSNDNQQPLFVLREAATPLFSTLKTPLLFYSHHIPQSSNSCFLSSFQECLCVLILVSSEVVNALRSTLTPSDKPLNCLWSSFPFLALSVLAASDHLNSRFSCAFP